MYHVHRWWQHAYTVLYVMASKCYLQQQVTPAYNMENYSNAQIHISMTSHAVLCRWKTKWLFSVTTVFACLTALHILTRMQVTGGNSFLHLSFKMKRPIYYTPANILWALPGKCAIYWLWTLPVAILTVLIAQRDMFTACHETFNQLGEWCCNSPFWCYNSPFQKHFIHAYIRVRFFLYVQ